MAVRRSSLCLFCRQTSIGRRKATTTTRQRLETTTTSKPDDDGFLLHGRRLGTNHSRKDKLDDGITVGGSRKEETEAETEALRQGWLEFEAFNKQRAMRLGTLQNLRNPWPQWNEKNNPMNGHRNPKLPEPPEAAAAPIPHAVFRQLLKDAEGFKAMRQILRTQLLRCEHPKDVLRITAVAMNNPIVALNLAALDEPIIRAMYRCRNNVSDPEVLRTIKMLATRFDMAGLRYGRHILYVGLKFAARARSLSAMAWFLRRIREHGQGMSSHIFRSVIAKFSIGHRGLGEIRNGRWRRAELMQVLTGFEDCAHLPPEQQYHLGSFMIRDDWQYLHGWVAVLARCRDADRVWQEWEHWRTSPARLHPRPLEGLHGMDTRMRGDYWFIEQMTYAKDIKRAWQIMEATGQRFSTLKVRVKSALLEGIEHSPPGLWNEEMREALIWKYDFELGKIEEALGVTWSSDSFSHSPISEQAQEDALERLAAKDFGKEAYHGFPLDDEVEDGAIVENRERDLHDAEEEGEDGQRIPGFVQIGPGMWQRKGLGDRVGAGRALEANTAAAGLPWDPRAGEKRFWDR